MKISDIYNYLDELSPFELQEAWDNSGLIVGGIDDSFDEVVISLDLDIELVKTIKPNSLILTHHPLIFKGLKKLNFNDYESSILKELIKKDIKLISLHTNYDKTHLNRFVFEKILGFTVYNEEDFILSSIVDLPFDKLVTLIKDKLNLEVVRFVKTKDYIKTLSLTTGSGMSLIEKISSDCFLTGDIKYHEAMGAKAKNISLIDIGHFESEQFFTKSLGENLSSYLKLNKINCIITNNKNPFEYIN